MYQFCSYEKKIKIQMSFLGVQNLQHCLISGNLSRSKKANCSRILQKLFDQFWDVSLLTFENEFERHENFVI